MKTHGLVYVFTGEGKGKTSAALGVGVRASLSGMSVAMVQWYKDPKWNISEHRLTQFLPNFSIYPMGKGFKISTKSATLSNGGKVFDTASASEHHLAAQQAMITAKTLINHVNVLILDEVSNAVKDSLIDEQHLIDLINHRNSTHIIITGRYATPKIIKLADLVTQMTKIKHPYDQGILAVKGLDF